MTFGEGGWRAGEDAADSIFLRYIEAGGNVIATAINYAGGRSEEMLGTFMNETGMRDRLVVATKFAVATRPGDLNSGGNDRKNIVASLDTFATTAAASSGCCAPSFTSGGGPPCRTASCGSTAALSAWSRTSPACACTWPTATSTSGT
ncbi:aldo/keto reductase [Actinomadura madurae]|uniref:aldo/keto reductase n=1 Tax=Actinomadura madurae TaxID=1993 RepID=UPI0011BE36D6